MNAHFQEYIILVGVILFATAAHIVLKNIEDNCVAKAEKMLTVVLGGNMLTAGLLKFFYPFATMFTQQIAMSQLPLPAVSKWLGMSAEIGTGILLLILAFGGLRLPKKLAHSAFVFANLTLISIMTVALYVHFQYEVPATILPFGCKYPVLSIVVMAFAARNLRLHQNKKALVTERRKASADRICSIDCSAAVPPNSVPATAGPPRHGRPKRWPHRPVGTEEKSDWKRHDLFRR